MLVINITEVSILHRPVVEANIYFLVHSMCAGFSGSSRQNPRGMTTWSRVLAVTAMENIREVTNRLFSLLMSFIYERGQSRLGFNRKMSKESKVGVSVKSCDHVTLYCHAYVVCRRRAPSRIL